MSLWEWMTTLIPVPLGIFGLKFRIIVDDIGVTYQTPVGTKKIPWTWIHGIQYAGWQTELYFYVPGTGRESCMPTSGLDPQFFKDVQAHLEELKMASITHPENSV